jgi:sulfur-carrier protein
MKVKILFFGPLVDLTGCDSLEADHLADTESIRSELLQRYPALAGASFVLALDNPIVSENTPVPENSTIALLPPFSGG